MKADPSLADLEIELCKRDVKYLVENYAWTYDPRNAGTSIPARLPFDLWPKQRVFLDWLNERSEMSEDGLVEKSRDSGFTWLCVAWAWHKWRFVEGYDITFGSRVKDLVDKMGDPDTIFEKLRAFYRSLPRWLLPLGFNSSKHDNYMRLINPQNGTIIKGQGGEDIGRGGRVKAMVLDEAAFLERADAVEAATSATAAFRIWGSTVNGTNNLFYRKRTGGTLAERQVFVFDILDDPRKTPEWIAKKKRSLEPHVWASEYARNYAASVDRLLIPNEWVRACIDAHKVLGIAVTGQKGVGYDVADEGRDLNAIAGGQGILIDVVEQWSGKGSDIFASTEWVFDLADDHEWEWIRYDSDGVGADVRGAARVINERRRAAGAKAIGVIAYRGSEAVIDPERKDVPPRKNKDYFANRKAQEWWRLRTRIRKTYEWVVEKRACDADEILSLSSEMENLTKLITELSQPTYSINGAGKILIDKAPDGSRSPNMADAVVIREAKRGGLVVPAGTSESIIAKPSLAETVRQRTFSGTL